MRPNINWQYIYETSHIFEHISGYVVRNEMKSSTIGHIDNSIV